MSATGSDIPSLWPVCWVCLTPVEAVVTPLSSSALSAYYCAVDGTCAVQHTTHDESGDIDGQKLSLSK